MLPIARAFQTLLLVAVPLAAQRVWVVAPVMGPGVDFIQIQPAIDAAVDGDMVLVRAGNYLTFQIDAKSVAVVADGVTVALSATGPTGVRIANLGAHQSALVRGFSHGRSMHALSITACQGAVLVEDCQFTAFATAFSGAGALVSNSPRVTLARCGLSCIASRPGVGGSGLSAGGSNLTLHQCSVFATSATLSGNRGWPGAVLSSGFVFAAGCTVFGGSGAPGSNFGTCIPPGDGGDALHLSDATTAAVVLDCQLRPGQPGSPGTGCPPGSAGQPIGGPGTRTILAGAAGTLRAEPSPVRMGQNLLLQMQGPAGAATWLALSPIQSPVFVPSCNGVLHTDLATSAIMFVGFMSSGGQLTLPVSVPALGVLGVVVHLQMGMTLPSGCYLGAPSAILIADPRY